MNKKIKEERFEKVVEWEGREEESMVCGFMFGTLFFFSLISLILKSSELIWTFVIFGLLCGLIVGFGTMGKRKVYWRKIQ